jgi:hypothetical protein
MPHSIFAPTDVGDPVVRMHKTLRAIIGGAVRTWMI